MKLFFTISICFLLLSESKAQNKNSSHALKSKYHESNTYVFKNDTIIQTVVVDFFDTAFYDTSRIYFTITTYNRIENIQSSISDTAYYIFNRNAPDLYEYNDELDSLSYACVPYRANKQGCYLQIGIDFENNRNRLSVNEADDCYKFHNIHCPFTSVDTLRKQK